jgi:hypothetical protein
MPRGRPRGSKSRNTSAYARRTKQLKQKYGENIFRKWGKKGGNPVLLRGSRKKARKKEAAKKWPSWY